MFAGAEDTSSIYKPFQWRNSFQSPMRKKVEIAVAAWIRHVCMKLGKVKQRETERGRYLI